MTVTATIVARWSYRLSPDAPRILWALAGYAWWADRGSPMREQAP